MYNIYLLMWTALKFLLNISNQIEYVNCKRKQ